MSKYPAKCPRCGHRLEVDTAVGEQIVCSACQAVLAVPGKVGPRDKVDPLVGQRLGQYEVFELIGRGGMGAVYRARQTSLDRIVALKVLPRAFANDANFVERFHREARSAAAVAHPNIIEVFDVGSDRGYQFIAMELVEGEALGDFLQREGRLAPDRALDALKQVASALAAAHACGIVHRDVKPSNLLLTPEGRVKVADFGLAKRTGVDVSVTATGMPLGTPLYFPPEVARGNKADARSDLYSLGATFYHLVAGHPPVQGGSVAELAIKHLEGKFPPLSQEAPDASPAFCRIIHRLMARSPADRFQSAEELLDALEQGSPEGPADQTESTRTRPETVHASLADRRDARRQQQRRAAILASAIGGAAVVAAIVLVLGLGRGGEEAPPEAAGPEPPTKRAAAPPTKARTDSPKPTTKGQPPAWEAALAEAGTKARALATDQRFGEAVALYDALAAGTEDSALKQRAADAAADLGRQADGACGAMEARVSQLLAAGKFDEARAALRPVIERFGVAALADRAKQRVAEIGAQEQQARDAARWDEIKAAVARHLQAGDFDQAAKALEPARGLAVDNVAALAGQQSDAIEQARAAAAERALGVYEGQSDRAWALFKKGDYAAADALLAQAAADPQFKLAAEQVQADAQAARLLKDFWAAVAANSEAMVGKSVVIDGQAGTVTAAKGGTITLRTRTGDVPLPVQKLPAAQARRFAALPDSPHGKLVLGVFLLAEGEQLDEAKAALDAAGDSPAAAACRERLAPLLAGAEEREALAAWGRLEREGSGGLSPARAKGLLARIDAFAKQHPQAKLSEALRARVDALRARVETLSAKPEEPDAGKWIPLFNGKDLTGWTPKTGWAVEDGSLAWRKGCGYIWTEKVFGDFVLDLEFKIASGSNSGIFIRTGSTANAVKTGLEVQILDTFGKTTIAKNDCGGIYNCVAPSKNTMKRPGEWNRMIIACKGSRVQVAMNGEVITSMDLALWTEAGKNPDGTSNPLGVTGRDLLRPGCIGFQDYSVPVWFRNIRVRLPD